MSLYLDSSTIGRVVFQQAGRLSRWGQWDDAYTSELTWVELRRALERLRLTGELEDRSLAAAQQALVECESAIPVILVSQPVLRRASQPMGTAVKTLDAIHLATALLLREQRAPDLIFATHDARQANSARALGFSCRGVD